MIFGPIFLFPGGWPPKAQNGSKTTKIQKKWGQKPICFKFGPPPYFSFILAGFEGKYKQKAIILPKNKPKTRKIGPFCLIFSHFGHFYAFFASFLGFYFRDFWWFDWQRQGEGLAPSKPKRPAKLHFWRPKGKCRGQGSANNGFGPIPWKNEYQY